MDEHCDKVNPIRPFDPAVAASSLDERTIDVWWLDYVRAQGREPMRALIAAYLGCAADAVTFAAGPHGKPHLTPPGATHLACNWSHSGTRAVVALARHLPTVGIDIETRQRHRRDVLALARRFFSADEADTLAALAADERELAFIALWTAKEATLKADGSGISYGLDRVGFEWRGRHWQPRHFDGPVGDAGTWQLRGWKLDEGCCHLAWRGPSRTIRHYRPG